ncbi:MAG: alpha-ketoglutarate-dependent dioxygenase AlkB [Planctomycetota bacterium]
MSGLFDNEPLAPVSIVGNDITLIQNANLGRNYDELLEELIVDTPWRQEEITLFGKTMLQPRLIAWYADAGVSYSYSGTRLRPLPWSETLLDLRRRIEAVAGHSFNSVLLNYYRDQHDSMGLHSDDEPELGVQPVIVSLTLGAKRSFQLKNRFKRELPVLSLPLPAGSLLIMRGNSQHDWRHGLPKSRQACGARVNLTFRRTGVE